eukprot:9954506-Ditylum_brightwellii.AAC.1
MMGIGGWGWFSSCRAVLESSPFLALVYNAPISTSAAKAITLRSSSHTSGWGCWAILWILHVSRNVPALYGRNHVRSGYATTVIH